MWLSQIPLAGAHRGCDSKCNRKWRKMISEKAVRERSPAAPWPKSVRTSSSQPLAESDKLSNPGAGGILQPLPHHAKGGVVF